MSDRLQEIADMITAGEAREQAIDAEIKVLQAERKAIRDTYHKLTDEARELAPEQIGDRYEVPNDLPRDFSKCEIVAYAIHYAHNNKWAAWVEDVYDGARGASDPTVVDYPIHDTAEAALAAANPKAAEMAQRAMEIGTEEITKLW